MIAHLPHPAQAFSFLPATNASPHQKQNGCEGLCNAAPRGEPVWYNWVGSTHKGRHLATEKGIKMGEKMLSLNVSLSAKNVASLTKVTQSVGSRADRGVNAGLPSPARLMLEIARGSVACDLPGEEAAMRVP